MNFNLSSLCDYWSVNLRLRDEGALVVNNKKDALILETVLFEK